MVEFLGVIVARRLIVIQSVESDKITFLIYSSWLVAIYRLAFGRLEIVAVFFSPNLQLCSLL